MLGEIGSVQVERGGGRRRWTRLRRRALSTSSGARLGLANVLFWIGKVQAQQGEGTAALDSFAEARVLYEQSASASVSPTCCMGSARCRRSRGRERRRWSRLPRRALSTSRSWTPRPRQRAVWDRHGAGAAGGGSGGAALVGSGARSLRADSAPVSASPTYWGTRERSGSMQGNQARADGLLARAIALYEAAGSRYNIAATYRGYGSALLARRGSSSGPAATSCARRAASTLSRCNWHDREAAPRTGRRPVALSGPGAARGSRCSRQRLQRYASTSSRLLASSGLPPEANGARYCRNRPALAARAGALLAEQRACAGCQRTGGTADQSRSTLALAPARNCCPPATWGRPAHAPSIWTKPLT